MTLLSRRLLPFVFACTAGLLLAGTLSAAGSPRQLEWDDLMPPNWDPLARLDALRDPATGAIEDGSPEAEELMRRFVTAGRSAPVVPALDGQQVKIPGFVVPLDFEGRELTEFLLVPYFGACIHVPPPPANQIVYVKTAKPYSPGEMFDPVWVQGTLRTQAHWNDVGDAGYTLEATAIEVYREGQ